MQLPRIYIIGLPGAGKTTVAQALSDALNLPWLDIDLTLKDTHKKSVQELFTMGEAYFRSLESNLLLTSCDTHNIISTGGGIVMSEINRTFLKQQTHVIYLNRSIESILKTLDVTDRPLFNQGTDVLKQLYDYRHLLYQQCCSVEIENNGTLEECIQEILHYLGGLDEDTYY